jgi:UDP-galactopyranose mutase
MVEPPFGRAVPRLRVKRVAVIGAGWAGAAAARELHDRGVAVEVFEAADVVGGHSRAERLNGVLYEPNGPHVFHTSNARVADFVHRFGLVRPYAHRPLTMVRIDGEPRYFSWPLQLAELGTLPQWDRIRMELAGRPSVPATSDFEAYCVSLMGETLYHLFVYHYTVKQWGVAPRALAAEMAARRVHLRDNGDRRLHHDAWEHFPSDGVNPVVEAVLHDIPVHRGVEVHLADLGGGAYRAFDAAVVTAPLDAFAGEATPLPWRGIRVQARYRSTDELDTTVTRAYTVNQPDPDVPFTRTVETKHASGQRIRGTVVCEEYPGHPAKHYPVPTASHEHERRNRALQALVRRESPLPVAFCGRLANYVYINQDEAILQGLLTADELLGPE